MKPAVRTVDKMAWVPRMMCIPSSEVHPDKTGVARTSAAVANEFLARMVYRA